jgi:hypothetical protein
MLSLLNTLIGFAALFALLSLIVTTATQLLRTALGFGSRRLVDTLLRLFGEIKEPERFVAAMLSHPSLTGPKAQEQYRRLVDPSIDEKDVRFLAQEILESHRTLKARLAYRRRLGTWPTADLDKQTVKDIASTVYARIGPRVDPFPDAKDPLDSGVLERWGTTLMAAVAPSLASPKTPGATAVAAQPTAPPAVVPHLGRLWLLATAAFPEGEGKANPIKTYVAAFFDESSASVSDLLTMRIRRYTAIIALLLAIGLQLDAIAVWNRFAGTDPKVIDEFAKGVQALSEQKTATVGAAVQAPSRDEQITQLQQQVAQMKSFPLDIGPRKFWKPVYWDRPWQHAFGILLAWMALALGAPFWFQILKSAIQMKSAFTKDDGGKK